MSRRAKQTISDVDEQFALEYLSNGYNGTAAYKKTHPRAAQRTAEVQASKILRKPEVKACIEKELAERKRRLQMDGDEALEAITRHARGDIRKLFKDNRLMPISEWPDDAADCVHSIKPGPFGTAITFYNKLDARKTMAVAGGKLKATVDHKHLFPHLELLGEKPPEDDDE